jgi:hypothetical protein
MAIGEIELQSVIANGGGGAGSRARLIDRQHGNGAGAPAALITTDGAGAVFSEVSEVVVAAMAIAPGHFQTSTAGDVNLYSEGLSAEIGVRRHMVCFHIISNRPLGQALPGPLPMLGEAAGARGDGMTMGTGARVAEESADFFIEFRADDVFEFAGLRISHRILD